jgi:glycosyltransferase involved in cell wall biosynthesis
MIDTSKYESLSIPSIEGLASGLVIVGPDISGINTLKRLVPDGVSIVEKRKPEYYIEKIDYYSHLKSADPAEFERRRELIKQEAEQQFDKTIIGRSIKGMILKTPENKNKISIVTASLNEGANIKRYLDQVMNLIRSKHINSIDEIVIVDDGSTDNTISAIETFAKENTDIAISLVKRSKKMGTVDAQIAGANRAKNQYILVMDCDLQHPVEYIEKFVEKFNYGYEIIIGSRYIVGSKNSWEPKREVISRVATMIAHIMFPFTFKIKDPLAGYFLCKRSIIVNLKPYRYMYKLLLYVLIFNNINKNYTEIPIEMKSRTGGESKVVNSYSRTVLMYSREILTYYRDYNKSKWKIN